MSTHPLAKLTEDQVRDAVARYRRGEPARSIARSLGVSPPTVGQIMAGRTWVRVTGGPVERPRPWQASPAERERMVELRREGLSQAAIARRVGRSACTVSQVLRDRGMSARRYPMNRKDQP